MFSCYFKKACVLLIKIIRETQIPRSSPCRTGTGKASSNPQSGWADPPPPPAGSSALCPPINNLPAFASSDAYRKGQLSELAGTGFEGHPGIPGRRPARPEPPSQPRGTGLGSSPTAAWGGRRIGQREGRKREKEHKGARGI